MMIEPPTLVRILDRMESLGWIRRQDCPADRRRKLIRMTDRAEPIWSQMVTVAKQVRQVAGRGLTADELYVLKDLLHRVRDNLTAEKLIKSSGTVSDVD